MTRLEPGHWRGGLVGGEAFEAAGHADFILSSNGCGCCVGSLSEMEDFKQGVQIYVLERHFGR